MNEETAAHAGGSENPGQGSAPDNKSQSTGGKVDTAPTQTGSPSAGVRREFFNLREKVRTEKEEKESIRQELESLKAKLAEAEKSAPKKNVDFYEDPDGFRAALVKQAREEARAELEGVFAQRRVEASAVQAENWLLSRNHLQEDSKAGDEVARIIESDYAHVAKTDPRAAAKSAYLDWCESKGVSPDLSREARPERPVSVRPSNAIGNSSDKVYTPDEVRKTMFSLKGKEREAYAREVEKAAKEGRFRGKVISLHG